MPLPLDALAILSVAAIGTSIVSAILGLAGGITLLAIMLLFLEPLVALPLHGAVQLVSNASRTWLQREHVVPGIVWRYALLLIPGGVLGLLFVSQLSPGVVQLVSNASRTWLQREHVVPGIVWRYALLLIPGGVLGLLFVSQLSPGVVKAAIGVFVLVATWAPRWLLLGVDPAQLHPYRRFIGLGGALGALSMAIGATGPLAAPFFLNLGLSRQGVVGTAGACQATGHLAKILIFGVAGFAFTEWLVPLAALAAAVIVGTWIGTRLLDRVTETTFVTAYKVALSLIALRFLAIELQSALTRI